MPLLILSTSIWATLNAGCESKTLEQFLTALETVESGRNPNSIGDNGKALGILQIHAIMVRDYNRITGANLRHKDALDPATARKICLRIFAHYEPRALADGDWQTLARLWNCGPSWRKYMAKGDKYWRKVMRALNCWP